MPAFDAVFLAACVVVFLAAAAAGLAGFGFSIVSVPILLWLYEPGTVIALNKFLTLGTTWIILVSVWRSISWSLLVRLVPTALLGLGLGIGLLRLLDATAIKVLAGVVVTGFAILLLVGGVRIVPRRGWMAPLAGVVSGTLSTSTGLAGPPVVLLFTVIGVSVEMFRATSVTYFLLIDMVAMPSLVAQGLVGQADAVLALTLVPVALAGRYAGSWLVPHISPLQFRRVTLVLLLVTGAISIANGVRALG